MEHRIPDEKPETYNEYDWVFQDFQEDPDVIAFNIEMDAVSTHQFMVKCFGEDYTQADVDVVYNKYGEYLE